MTPDSKQLVRRLKAFADSVRLRLVALCSVAECSVSELTHVTGLSQPRVSQHLKQLIAAGLLERFRDGQFVYYRVPSNGVDSLASRRLLALLPDDEPEFERDVEKLRQRRTGQGPTPHVEVVDDRLLHKALVELTVAAPLGDLLDIGCGQGRILKLLATRAQRAVGVDIDSDARRLARAELLLAGSPNCTLRQGDMYSLPFGDHEFDTVILDDVLGEAERPMDAVQEAQRLVKDGGRLLLLATVDDTSATDTRDNFIGWAAQAGLRLAPPRTIPDSNPDWLLGVGTA